MVVREISVSGRGGRGKLYLHMLIFFLAYACAFIYFQNMNEASSLLSATCNTFITTLEECVKIANAKFKPEMFQLPHPDPLVSPVSPSPIQMVWTF